MSLPRCPLTDLIRLECGCPEHNEWAYNEEDLTEEELAYLQGCGPVIEPPATSQPRPVALVKAGPPRKKPKPATAHDGTARTCAQCSNPVKGGLVLCSRCYRRLERELASQTSFQQHLELELARQVSKQAPTDGGRSATVPLPYAPAAGDLLNRQHELLVQWVRDLVESKAIADWPADSIPTMASAVGQSLPKIRTSDDIALLATEVHRLTERIVRIIDSPENRTRIHVGPCPNLWPVDEDGREEPCPGEVTAVVPNDESVPATMVCSACDAAWDTTQWAHTGDRIRRRQQQLVEQKAAAEKIIRRTA